MATNSKQGGDRYLLILDTKRDSSEEKGKIDFLADSYIKYFNIPTGTGGRCFSTRKKDFTKGVFRALDANVLSNCGPTDKLYICGHGNKSECGDHDAKSLAKLLSKAGLKRIGLITFKSCCIGQSDFLDKFMASCGAKAIQMGYAKGYKDSLYANKHPDTDKPISVIGKIKGKTTQQVADSRLKTNTERFKILKGPLADDVQWDDRFLSEAQLQEKLKLNREKEVDKTNKNILGAVNDPLSVDDLPSYDFGMKTVIELS
ncbi:MAG: hypothetical protein EOP36_09575 [Rubrivivax sp.]|nr:MAG: hypothetical protein EOP36_09575 [Rubrivivax sp.]